MKSGYTELVNEMIIQAAKDYKAGYKALYAQFGKKFLEPGFAVRVPERKDDVILPYAVAATKKRLSHAQNKYFDALDFFMSDYFASVSGLDAEVFLLGLCRGTAAEISGKELYTAGNRPEAA